MPRKPHQPAPINVEPGPLPEAHAITMMETQVVNAIENNHSEERDLLNQMFGQVQMAQAFRKFADVVSLTKLAHIKETKMYRALAGKGGTDIHGEKIADVGTWDGFCRALGSSKTKVDEDLLNLKVFGEDALESLTRIGAGVREMRQYRRLPTDERMALIEAAKAGDKDELLDLAETLISKHVQEKQALEARATEAEETAEARDTLVKNKQIQIDKLEEANHKLKRRVETLPPAEAALEIRKEADHIAFLAEHEVGNLRKAFTALNDHAGEFGGIHSEFMLGLIMQIELATALIRADFGLLKAGPDGDPTPHWMRHDQPAVN